MAYRQPSSGSTFKMMGSSPAKDGDNVAETDATSVAKPITPKVTGGSGQYEETTDQKFAEDFFNIKSGYGKSSKKLVNSNTSKKGTSETFSKIGDGTTAAERAKGTAESIAEGLSTTITNNLTKKSKKSKESNVEENINKTIQRINKKSS